jgi:hypothetical protein
MLRIIFLVLMDCRLQIDPKTGKAEGLSFEFNLCEAVASWEQVSMCSIDKSM